jgi:hypothetical protein
MNPREIQGILGVTIGFLGMVGVAAAGAPGSAEAALTVGKVDCRDLVTRNSSCRLAPLPYGSVRP